MDTYYKTEDHPLEPAELRKLKRGIWIIPIFLIIFGVGFTLFFQNVNPNDGFFFWALVVFAFFFAGIMGQITWGLAMDMHYKTKQVFQGLVTKKEFHWHSGKGKSRSYFLHFGDDKRIRVEPHIYNKFEEGDLIEIHRSKRLYNMIYKTEVLKRDAVMQVVADVKQQQLSKQQRIGFALILLFVLVVGGFVASVFLGFIEW